MKPTTLTFDKQYDDNSGVWHSVSWDSSDNAFGLRIMSISDEVCLPLEHLSWLIDALTTIREKAL